VNFVLRNFAPGDAERVNEVALDAFSEFRDEYSDWETLARNLGNTAALAESGEMIVAAVEGDVVGAVVYVAPGRPKREFFDPEWPVVRMLVVSPRHRGLGIGRALMEECVRRAARDRAPLIALHTSPIMTVALPLYLRMGFVLHRDAPSLLGVPYGIYVKPLG
jgi:GNAT superfamily N-acetyltransferase